METNIEFDTRRAPRPGTITIRYVIEPEEPPSVALLTVLSELVGSDPTAFGPLYPNVDLEALDEILDSPEDASPWATSVQLTIGEYELSIDSSTIVAAGSFDLVSES